MATSLAGVDRHVLRELTSGDEVLAARKRLRHVQPVDLTSKYERARRLVGVRRFRAPARAEVMVGMTLVN